MSSVQSIGNPDVRSAIAVAAQSTGVDFDYLLAQARLESSLDPSARARGSSAAGLFQFTGATWLSTLDRHGADHGLEWAGAAIRNGQVADPALRSQILALRFNPQVAALMAGELANDNRAALGQVLGREPDSAELYLAHFLGSDGAARFLTALHRDPGQSAAAILPRAAAANRTIFFSGSGAPRSVGDVMNLLRTRLGAAMDTPEMPPVPGSTFAAAQAGPAVPVLRASGPVAQEFHAGSGAGPARSQRLSMADTLRAAFGLTDGGPAPDHVRTAYGRLQAFGM